MKHKQILTSASIISVATLFVLIYSWMHPEVATITISVYIITIILMFLIFAVSNAIYYKNNPTIDIMEFSGITEGLNTEIVLWTNDGSALFMNKKLRDELGIKSPDFDNKAMLKKIFDIKDINNRTVNLLINEELGESHITDKNNMDMYIAWSTSLIKQTKECCLYMSTGFNFTELKRMQNKLETSHQRHKLSMELSEIGIILSRNDETFHISHECMRMLGYSKSTISFKELKMLIHPNDRNAYASYISANYKSKNYSNEITNLEVQIKSSDNTYHWYSMRLKTVPYKNNEDFPVIGGAIIDITSEREKDLTIEKLAFTDDVTEIPNRNKLVKIGEENYNCCRELGYSYWVMVFDIDKFHIINDTYGYSSGNKILKSFAHNLYKYVSLGGLAARISGDNFAVIIRDYGDEELPKKTAEQIQRDFQKLAKNEFSVQSLSCSVGYAKMPADGANFTEVLEHAEFALKSSDNSRNNICGYESNMHDAIINNNELEKSLADAIENNELKLFYQPKIDLNTGLIMGVEALIRWIKPDGTVISPNIFVPVAENSHLIGKISDFVLKEGCRQNVMWQKMGYPEIVMSINFTSDDFYQKNMKEHIFEALVTSGLDAKWLEVELTERLALHDVDYAVSQMNQIRELGVKLAMDDFGTGYSSLSYIQILPITLLKLDRSFIIDIETDPIAFEIVNAVIRIAKSKKIETIAEGIENPKQAEILRKLGCDFGQGYLYGKPMPPEELEKFFEKNKESQK
ncbi:MAG: GGDEF domain-containing protein [Oscillospiraceae bacterium]|nr:GGDEF domain-containing protein [Oscillospiraceae bacterium]